MMVNPSNQLPPDRVLLVEGQDDKHFVWQICGQATTSFTVYRMSYEMSVTLNQSSTTFKILEKGNRDELIKAIGQELVVRGRQAVGVLIDADSNVATSWADVVGGFSNTGIQLPSAPSHSGTIVQQQNHYPRVGVWIMPNNQIGGELEDFAVRMVSSTDTLWPFASTYVQGMPAGRKRFHPSKTDKAILFAWLASMREPGRFGAAIGAGDLHINGQLCQVFIAWLLTLFS